MSPSKPPPRKKSYEATTDSLVVLDRRQYTNGETVPNYVIDLWLPILEYCGLGVWATLCRLSSFSQANGSPRVILRQLARSGGMGFTRLRKILDQLESLQFLKVHIPTGVQRGLHYRTVIEIFDPPKEVPRKYTKITRGRTYLKDVHGLSAVAWMIEPETKASEVSPVNSPSSQVEPREVSPVNSMEFSPVNSMEVPPVNSMEFTPVNSTIRYPIVRDPIEQEPIRKEPTHTPRPPSPQTSRGGVGVSKFTREVRKQYADCHHSFNPKNGERIPLGEGWLVDSRDGRYDEGIAEWLDAPKKIDPKACPDCLGTGFVRKTLFDERGAQRCAHPRLRESEPGREVTDVPN